MDPEGSVGFRPAEMKEEHCKQRGLVMGETLAVFSRLRATGRIVFPSLGFQEVLEQVHLH